MKHYTLLIAFLISFASFSQNQNVNSNEQNSLSKEIEKFTFNKDGLSPESVDVKVKKRKNGDNDKDLYPKLMNWIKEKYGENIKVSGNKEKIQINGFTNNAICFGLKENYKCRKLTYLIEVAIGSNEYKFTPKKLSYIPESKNDKNEHKINLNKSEFHEKNGAILNDYQLVPSQIETLFNDINKSILNYLTDSPQEEEW